MSPRAAGTCKDCGSGTRKLPYPGPRCGACHRKIAGERRVRAHEAYVAKTYNLAPGQYQAMYEAQGGVCYICRVARGLTRWLCVDHWHGCCASPTSCGRCVRGLLCGPCNKLIGRLGPEALRRAATYLEERSV